MRVLLFIALLSLSACAKQPASDPEPTCLSYAGAFEVLYPSDTQLRKSDIAECSGGTFKVTSLETGDASAFTAANVTVRLMSVSALGVVSYYYTTL